MVTLPVPPSEPFDCVREPMVDALVTVSVPPVMLNRPVPVNDWMVTVPLRKTVSKEPSAASSGAPGKPGFQLPATSQKPAFGPTHVMVAGQTGSVASANAAPEARDTSP